MNLRKKLALALIATGLVSGGAQAAIDDFTSGDSSVVLSLVDTTAGVSALFDLGLNLSTLFANVGTSGYSLSYNLNSGDYAAAYNSLLGAGATTANLRWNVIAGDNTGATSAAQSNRYLSTSTSSDATVRGTLNAAVLNFTSQNTYLAASNQQGNHQAVANGADQVNSGASNSYFVTGFGSNRWGSTVSPFNTLAALGVGQKFWYLANTGGASTQSSIDQVFGVDVNGNGSIGTNEYGQWNVSSTGLVTFVNPTLVPEADTWAMFAAGLIAVGAIARRRLAA